MIGSLMLGTTLIDASEDVIFGSAILTLNLFCTLGPNDLSCSLLCPV